MKIVQVYEENHGDICLAATVQDAIDYLFNMSWIDETTEVWDNWEQSWVTVPDYFGENWKDQISCMSLADFNEVFEGGFSMEIRPVYERKS